MRRRRASHGLGSYDREYDYVERLLEELASREHRMKAALSRLHDAAASGNRGRVFDAKGVAREALNQLARALDSARIAEGASGGHLDRLPKHGGFEKAHDLMHAFRREIARASALRSYGSRAAFGSLEEVRERLGAERDVARLHGLARRRGLRLSQVDRRQLAKGTHVEKEHTRSRRVARRIALDHLAEHPRYYDKLEAAGLDARRSRRRAVRRDPPGTRCPIGTKVQTLLLARAEFRSASAARAWAREHGFSDAKVDPDVHFFRLRQAHPHAFRAGSLRTIHLRPGVMAVVGCPK